MAYGVVRGVFLLLARPWLRFRVVGGERIPGSGPAVLVAAHRSWLDPPCIVGACGRPVSFLILDTVFARPWARWLYRAVRAIPVSDGGGRALAGTREALRRLARGEVIGVFPEGRVYDERAPGALRPGAAHLAVRMRAPIVPLHIEGSAEAWPRGRLVPRRGRIVVHVGAPFEPPDASRGAVAELTSRIGASLIELAEAARDGERVR